MLRGSVLSCGERAGGAAVNSSCGTRQVQPSTSPARHQTGAFGPSNATRTQPDIAQCVWDRSHRAARTAHGPWLMGLVVGTCSCRSGSSCSSMQFAAQCCHRAPSHVSPTIAKAATAHTQSARRRTSIERQRSRVMELRADLHLCRIIGRDHPVVSVILPCFHSVCGGGNARHVLLAHWPSGRCCRRQPAAAPASPLPAAATAGVLPAGS